MKKIQTKFPVVSFSFVLAGILLISAWKNPHENNYSGRVFNNIDHMDTVPVNKTNNNNFNSNDLEKAMKNIDINIANIDAQMKDLKVNVDEQIDASLSKIDFEKIEKQTEEPVKQIDWNKMQQQVANSLQRAQKEIAQIDFTKMQNDMKNMQEKLKSEEFKSQFNSEKMQQQIDEAMSKAKENIEKAKEHLKQLNDFTDELAADGLIDKKKGYTIEWKNGSLYINGKEQSNNISDKYRRFENDGEIKVYPESAEYF